MDVIVLGLYDEPQPTVRYQRVPLDSRFPASREMKLLMAALSGPIEAAGLRRAGAAADAGPAGREERQIRRLAKVRVVPRDVVRDMEAQRARARLQDVGRSRSAAQFRSRVRQLPRRRLAPDQVLPLSKADSRASKKTPHLINTGCEDCHGPGEKHCAAEMGDNEALQLKYRKAVVITKEQSKKEQCMTCHDLDNSPDFDFDKYWPLIEHKEETEKE